MDLVSSSCSISALAFFQAASLVDPSASAAWVGSATLSFARALETASADWSFAVKVAAAFAAKPCCCWLNLLAWACWAASFFSDGALVAGAPRALEDSPPPPLAGSGTSRSSSLASGHTLQGLLSLHDTLGNFPLDLAQVLLVDRHFDNRRRGRHVIKSHGEAAATSSLYAPRGRGRLGRNTARLRPRRRRTPRGCGPVGQQAILRGCGPEAILRGCGPEDAVERPERGIYNARACAKKRDKKDKEKKSSEEQEAKQDKKDAEKVKEEKAAEKAKSKAAKGKKKSSSESEDAEVSNSFCTPAGKEGEEEDESEDATSEEEPGSPAKPSTSERAAALKAQLQQGKGPDQSSGEEEKKQEAAKEREAAAQASAADSRKPAVPAGEPKRRGKPAAQVRCDGCGRWQLTTSACWSGEKGKKKRVSREKKQRAAAAEAASASERGRVKKRKRTRAKSPAPDAPLAPLAPGQKKDGPDPDGDGGGASRAVTALFQSALNALVQLQGR
ncbi:unnamed protein product, partial [Effrenium voratum]